LIVRDAVDELPQASVDVQVRVCERLQPVATTAAVVGLAVTGPQLSVAVAVPSAESIAPAVGLQPRFAPLAVEPVAVMTGGVISNVQLIVRDAVDELPQASVDVQVRVCERLQPVATTAAVVGLAVTGPQLSVAVAVPSAESIAPAVGLQPRFAPLATEPVAVITGGVTSSVHVAVRDVDAEFPQASVAVHVLVCERPQPVLDTEPVVGLAVTGPQSSVAVADPRAESIAPAVGLHPRASGLPEAVITGGVTSSVQLIVREAVDELPHASVEVHVLVCERVHPVT